MKKLTRKIEFIVSFLYYIFLKVTFTKKPSIILYYHGVTVKQRDQFKKQMEYLAKDSAVISLSEFVNYIDSKVENYVAITFDDAFANLIENALPVIIEQKLHMSIFVPAFNLGTTPCWKLSRINTDRDELIMTTDQLQVCESSGVQLYSHTLSHPYLTQINENQLKSEVFTSKEQLEAILNHEVTMISYPHGDYDEKVKEEVGNAGYKYAFTIEPKAVRPGIDKFAIPRFMIEPEDSILKLKLILSGAYEAVYYLRKLKRLLKGAAK